MKRKAGILVVGLRCGLRDQPGHDLHRQRGAAEHRPRAGLRHADPSVGRRRLQPRVRCPGPCGGKPLRPGTDAARLCSSVSSASPSRPRWAGWSSSGRRAHRRAGRHGRLRGADLPGDAVGDLQRLSRPSPAGRRTRRLGCGGRRGCRDRAGRGRPAAHPLLVGQRVPRARSSRPGGRGPGRVLRPPVPRPPPRRRSTDVVWCSPARCSACSCGRSSRRRPAAGGRRRRSSGSPSPLCSSSRSSWPNGATSTPCSMSACSPTAGFKRRQRRRDGDLLLARRLRSSW